MQQIIVKHKNRYEVFQVLLMYNAHPYLSLKNSGKKVCIIHGKIWVVLFGVGWYLFVSPSRSREWLLGDNLQVLNCG